jgi:MerR family transcriptional regulator, copper efflux regulator
MTSLTFLKPGQLAEQAGVNLETLRYYEREGLLPAPTRDTNGYRQYTAEDVHRVRFIKKTQHLGFTLKEIRELLALRHDASAADIRQLTLTKLADIDHKLAELTRIRQALQKLADCCPGEGTALNCPILHYLDDCDL